MSRYVKYYSYNCTPNEIYDMASRFLITHGFVYKKYQNEDVFQKGQGWLNGPKFVKLTFNEGVLQLEAWVKFAVVPGVYAGEMDLTGTAGIATKRPLQNIMDNLEGQMMQMGCRPIAPPQPVYSTPIQPQPQYTQPAQSTQHTSPQQQQYTPPVKQAPPQPSQYTHPTNTVAPEKNGGKCLRCGGQVTPGAAFCCHCGLKR